MADSAPTPAKPKPAAAPAAPADEQDFRFLLQKQPFWTEFKELLFPPKQPELKLESTPIPVKDIWAPPRSLRSRIGSIAVHLAVVGIALLPFWRPVQNQIKKIVEIPIFVPPPTPPPPMPKIIHMVSGGSPAPAQAPKLLQPQVHVLTAPTSLVPLADVMNMPSFGSGPVVGSAPPGYGNGGGNGAGDGSGDGSGDGVGVTPPVPIYQPDPEYSDAARKAKFTGDCMVAVTIGADGHVHNAKVVQPLGLGLDEKAVQAVMTWRFTPAKDKNGRPISVTANILVSFHLY